MDIKTVLIVSWLSIILALELFFPFYKGRQKSFSHGLNNLAIGILNAILSKYLFYALTIFLFEITESNSIGIVNAFKLPYVLKLIFGFILLDLWTYFWHRLNHRFKYLWKFHKVHHSDTEMDSTSAIRFHTVEIALSSIFRIPIIFIIGLNIETLIVYESVLFFSTVFHHSNLNIPKRWDSMIQVFLVSPNMHRIHHSVRMKESNSNYTSLFSLWDKVFGTFKMIPDIKGITLGLKELRGREHQNVIGMLKSAFIKDGS